jgi:O-antigen ligase
MIMSRYPSVLMCCAYVIVIVALWAMIPHPAVAAALGLLPIAALLTIRYLFIWVLLFVLFSFFRLHEVFPVLMPFKLPMLLSLAALGSLAWHSLVSRSLTLYWSRPMSWLFAFWICVIVGLVMASNRGIAISSFTSVYWKIMVMTLSIIWVVNNPTQLKLACWGIVSCGLLVSLVAIQNALLGIGLVEGSRVTIGRNIGSMLGDPNDLALVLLFPLAFACGIASTSKLSNKQRFLTVIVCLCLSFAIIQTQSRGGLLGMMTVYAVFLQQAIRSKTVLISLAVVGAVVLYFVAGIGERASGGAAEAGIDASAMGRLYAWEAAFKMALDNPFTGVGLNNFYFNYYFYSPHWDGLNHAVHSTWFGVLAETGFLGLFVFLGLIASLVKTAVATLKRLKSADNPPAYLFVASKAVVAGLAGTVVSGTFLTQGFVWPIYILAALSIAIAQLSKQHSL